MRFINTGVVGLGRIGQVHLENLIYRVPAAKVIAASTPRKTGYDFARQLGVDQIYHDSMEVIHHPEIDAIILCSPTDTHLEFVEACARAGKHIFCEKPLEVSIDKIERIRSIIEETGVKLHVGFNRRFDPSFARVQAQVAEGKIGDPHILCITSRDPGPPPIAFIKVSGGLFMDMTIHDFDMSRFIVGSEVTEVFAKAAVRVDPAIGKAGDVDTAVITLSFNNGCIATINNSRKAVYGYDQRLEIFGSKGMSQLDNTYPDTQLFYDEQGMHQGLPFNFFMDRYTDSYVNEIQDFIDAIVNNRAVSVGIDDALKATQIALAAKRSVDTGLPVKMGSL